MDTFLPIMSTNVFHTVQTTLLNAVLFFCLMLISLDIHCQTYAGISMNNGNRLSFSPESDGFSRPVSISGSLLLRVQEEINENWALQYGFDLGVLGYKLQVNSVDTLFGVGPSVFTEYSTFYGRFSLIAGRVFKIKVKEMFIGMGGGASYYFSFGPNTTYDIGIIYPDGKNVDIFSAEIDSPSNSVLPFAKISTQLKVNFNLTVGLEYTHHFGSVLDGTYEFYHSPPPYSSGKISLYPGELSFIFLIQVSHMNRWGKKNRNY
jgi:hypothetical protein